PLRLGLRLRLARHRPRAARRGDRARHRQDAARRQAPAARKHRDAVARGAGRRATERRARLCPVHAGRGARRGRANRRAHAGAACAHPPGIVARQPRGPRGRHARLSRGRRECDLRRAPVGAAPARPALRVTADPGPRRSLRERWPLPAGPGSRSDVSLRGDAMDLDEALRTTFSCRDFTADPLPDAVLTEILERARFAPSGGNRQGWKVIVVRDASTRAKLAKLTEFGAKRYIAQQKNGENPWTTIDPPRVDAATIERSEPMPRLIEPVLKAPV